MAKEYIERSAANNALRECVRAYPNSFYNGIEVARTAIRKIPAANVREVVRGKWENDSDNLPVCSNCGEIALQRVFVKVPHLIQDVRMVRSSFCPNCGADMREPKEET